MSRTSIILAILFLLLFSCEEGYLTNCDECYTNNDNNVVLKIRYRNEHYVPINPVVTLYDGNISDSVIIEKFRITDPYSYIDYYAILYKDYSAMLEYTYDGKKYAVVASACPKVRHDETTCEESCWYVYDNILDLRLRYD
jgi:hypothetical protein